MSLESIHAIEAFKVFVLTDDFDIFFPRIFSEVLCFRFVCTGLACNLDLGFVKVTVFIDFIYEHMSLFFLV